MKKKNCLKELLAVGMAWIALSAGAQEKGSLTVHIEGLRNNEGKVMIALTDKEIPTDMSFIGADMAQADSTGMKFFFGEVPAMTVYVQVFHDENGNFQPDMTPEGKMKEGVGSLPGSSARPSVAVEPDKNNEMTIKMLYF